MRGKVTYRLIGGPYDGEINVMPAMYCRDRLAISDAWIAQDRDAGPRLMNGPMPPRAPWISFTRAVYEKVRPIMPGNVIFQHAFAERIGMERTWFHDQRIPHYDLTPSCRRLAVSCGAVEVDLRQAVDLWARI